MQRHPLHIILGRPAIHVLLALAFGAAFFWPIFALTRPTETFHALYLGWFVCLGALFAVSRAVPIDSAAALKEADEAVAADDVENTRESF
jgi:hypothetical protein